MVPAHQNTIVFSDEDTKSALERWLSSHLDRSLDASATITEDDDDDGGDVGY